MEWEITTSCAYQCGVEYLAWYLNLWSKFQNVIVQIAQLAEIHGCNILCLVNRLCHFHCLWIFLFCSLFVVYIELVWRCKSVLIFFIFTRGNFYVSYLLWGNYCWSSRVKIFAIYYTLTRKVDSHQESWLLCILYL